MLATYRTDRSYDWNYRHGPSFAGRVPAVPATPAKTFLGLPVRARIGIAAGLLLNSRWVELYARLGFDILTYKTVRAAARRSHPLPNWVFLERARGRLPRGARAAVRTAPRRGADVAVLSSTVSFGMPSKPPAAWMRDVARARRALGKGQVLNVSVVASPAPGDPPARMIDEFARLAGLACEAGAQVVEANLSCPNVCSAEGDIYHDAALSGRIARAMKRAAGATPVLLKIGYLPARRGLGRLLESVAGGADGVVMVNGIAVRIQRPDGAAAFGRGRASAGVLGRMVHAPSVAQVRSAVELVRERRLPLAVIGVGGVATPEDAGDFFAAGAQAVMLGSAPMYDPFLAIRIKRSHPQW
ncbi:MAG: hypothetical protein M5U08_26660 [Burkholderiales bacterium]|nr:hypothetical protein [Burkholderiales bacterium]